MTQRAVAELDLEKLFSIVYMCMYECGLPEPEPTDLERLSGLMCSAGDVAFNFLFLTVWPPKKCLILLEGK
ncbi:hypothetical protein STEG23_004908, partial [Scotinomys teguina]